MKSLFCKFTGKKVWMLLVLAITSQTMVSCGAQNDRNAVQVQTTAWGTVTRAETVTEDILSVSRSRNMTSKESGKEDSFEIVISGKCGKSTSDDVNFVMYKTGNDTYALRIYGTGRMDDFLDPDDFLTDSIPFVPIPLDLYKFHRPWDGSGENWEKCSEAIKKCTRIEVGEGITNIGEVALANFTNPDLKVSLPSTLTEIGGYAFALSRMSEIDIPASVEFIGDCAFAYSAAKEITLPDSLKQLGKGTFSNMDNMQKLDNWNDSITEIPDFLLSGSGIREFTVGDKVTKIGYHAFNGCEKLSAVYWNDKVKEIEEAAFAYTGIESMEIPDSVETMGDMAFTGCRKLKTVTLGKSQKDTELGYAFFEECTMLKKVVIPESVMEIGDSAFRGCKSLETVVIPDGVVRIGWRAFFECKSLKKITIPDGVTKIGKWAFYGSGLKTVALPNKIQTISEGAFEDCEKLTGIRLGKSLKTINKTAFKGCKSLKKIQVPKKQYKRYRRLLKKPLSKLGKVKIVKY